MEQFRHEAKMFEHLDGTNSYMSGGTLYVYLHIYVWATRRIS